MPNINKIFISEGLMHFQDRDSGEVYIYPFSDIKSLDIVVSSENKENIRCLMAFPDRDISFNTDISINYADFLEIIDYSSMRNFKDFLLYLERHANHGILANQVSEWITKGKSLKKDRELPEDSELRLSIARLSLMTLDKRMNRKQYKSRLEVFAYSSFGMLLMMAGFIMGYNQHLKGKFPFFFIFCLMGLFLIVLSFLPKKTRQY